MSSPSRLHRALVGAIVVLSAPLWLTFVAGVLLLQWLQVVVLYSLAWAWWIGWDRRRVLFVYSDSPNWKEYVEARILPNLPANTVVLNWSRRASWPRVDPSVILFNGFAGEREFNPIGLVFERFHVVGEYRFWQPFRDAKHGRSVPLQVMERQFLQHATGALPDGVISLRDD